MGQFTAEVRGLNQRLSQKIGSSFSPTCRAIFGDSRCAKVRNDYKVEAAVTASEGRQIFTASALAQDSGYFNYGVVKFSSGANENLQMEVKDFRKGQVTLVLPMPYDIEVGAEFEIFAGCDKTFKTCTQKFDNAMNFRGEPHVPGTDRILETAGLGRNDMELPYEKAESLVDITINELKASLLKELKRGYNSNQPRVPAGNSNGGQWAGGGSGNGTVSQYGRTQDGFIDPAFHLVNDPPVITSYPIENAIMFLYGGRVITALAEALGVSQATISAILTSIRNAEIIEEVAVDTEWTMGKHKSVQKWENQFRSRDWSNEQVQEALAKGKKFPAPNNVNKANTATRYELTNGKFVVRDDVTKEVLQVSGEGDFFPNKFDTKE